MCPEVIFTWGAFQVNYCKETACKVHKKVSPDFCTAPVEETCFAAALEHRHDEKTINDAPNWQYLSFFETVPRWKGLPSSGTPVGSGSWGCRDGPPASPWVAWALLAAYANCFMTKLYNSTLTFANASMSSQQCYACVWQIGKNPNPMGFGSCLSLDEPAGRL